MCVDLDRGYARYRATVGDGEGGKATGHGTETKADFADYRERAETRAMGRALAALGKGESPSQGPAEVHPTAEEITPLVDSARSANVGNDNFAHDMRRLMKLPEHQKLTKKFLRETMTMPQYNTARARYGEAPRRILEEDVPAHGSPSANDQPNVSQAASKANDEPNASEAGLDAAKAKLRAEAISWSVRASEVDHVLQHHPLAAARNMLWRARRD